MSGDLARWVAEELARPAPEAAARMGRDLAAAFADAQAVLFYGSSLRTGELDGLLDFYVLTGAPPKGLRGLASRVLWPDVSYHEADDPPGVVRAKVAAMTLARFRRAAGGAGVDTTVWTRFAQPARLVWSAGPEAAAAACDAVAQAVRTASRFAAALGPDTGPAPAFWEALFRQTYAAELRVEAQGRGGSILDHDPGRYAALLPMAWAAAGLNVEIMPDGGLSPGLSLSRRRRLLRAWGLRRGLGRPLNAARLVKAAFTFDGAARYAAWKIERHTGVATPLTPWRERHPVLAAPGVLWRLWRARRISG